MEHIKKIIEDSWSEKIRNDSFWTVFAYSYFQKDAELCKNDQRFITEILFYPFLIEELIKKLRGEKIKTTLEITFFSTLLPSHYWNFPIMFKEKERMPVFYTAQHDFIDNYREKIEQCIKDDNDNLDLILKRVLFVCQKEKNYNCFRNSHLFSKKRINEEKKYFVSYEKEGCYSFYNNKAKNDNLLKLDEFDIRELLSSHQETLDRQLIYVFNKHKNTNGKSLYDYYIEDLHSSQKDSALIFYVDKNNGNIKDLPKPISPDLALINIKKAGKTKKYILDVHMDIQQNIVSLKVIEEKDKKFSLLLDNINSIISNSEPLKTDRQKQMDENIKIQNIKEQFILILKQNLTNLGLSQGNYDPSREENLNYIISYYRDNFTKQDSKDKIILDIIKESSANKSTPYYHIKDHVLEMIYNKIRNNI